MPETTKIRKEQIRINEFIQALASADWTSDTLTVSAAAILAKIQSEIAGVSGAMAFRGNWTQAATDTIRKGYVYVYAGQGNGSIGTSPNDVVLEPGDTLIANCDNASITNPSHWTIVQVNITGAITEANLQSALNGILVSGNGNSLSITAPTTGTNAGKIVLTVNFPTVSGGAAETGKYVSGISINATTGVITVTKENLPTADFGRVVLDAVCLGTPNGSLTEFKTPYTVLANSVPAFYVNGVKQTVGVDYTYTEDQGYGKMTLASGAYIPKTGDTVTCSYVKG